MGLFNWLKSLLGKRQPTRNVAGLAQTDASLTEETIDTSAGPLNPRHLRLALRDKRLLPKPSIDSKVWPRPKKKRLMSSHEARRLFSDTLRTKNRNIRDLALDEEQLRRYRLPIWHNEADIAAALEISESELRHFSIHRQRETTPHYVTFAIPKRSGGQRLIHAPKKRLKAILRKLNTLLVNQLPDSDYAHGFRQGRSVATNAEPHVGKAVIIKMDLQDCFPSIHFGRVRGLLISLGYSYPVAATLATLMTEAPRQPVSAEDKTYHVPIGPRVCVQGAPTSPGLCNAVLCRLDRRLGGLAKKHGFDYTRYADDLTLSGNDTSKIKLLLTIAARIIEEEGFKPNPKKTRVVRKGHRQKVTGVIVNDQAGLSRKERRRLRAAIHQIDPSNQETRRHISGKLAYLEMLNPKQADPLRQAFIAVCAKS